MVGGVRDGGRVGMVAVLIPRPTLLSHRYKALLSSRSKTADPITR